jgi:nucleolar protein 15
LHIKTGRSKHYGFIEFVSAPVAQIVAETMDNYLLMGHIMACKVVPKDDVHPELWLGANRKWRVVPTYRLAQAQHNKVRSPASRLTDDRLNMALAASKRDPTTHCGETLDEETRGAETEACRGGSSVQL